MENLENPFLLARLRVAKLVFGFITQTVKPEDLPDKLSDVFQQLIKDLDVSEK